ncbi:MAG: alanine racemase, partial [Candidatus Krumholzibacteriia bacterium]
MKPMPTWVEIDLDALRGNVRLLRGELAEGVQVLLTVKADAYGHGAVRVARASETLVERFGVATLDEALELKAAGIG